MLGNVYSDDATQDAVVSLLENWDRVEKPEEMGRYGSRTTSNRCLDIIRHNKRYTADGLDGLLHSNPPRAAAADPLQVSLCREALDCLGARQREVTELFYFTGCSTSEIGERLGMSAGHVQVELHRSREKMRERLGA